jgi:hypothetical protein
MIRNLLNGIGHLGIYTAYVTFLTDAYRFSSTGGNSSPAWPHRPNFCQLVDLFSILGSFLKITGNFWATFSHGRSYLLILTKNPSAYILCKTFTNSSGHPGHHLHTCLTIRTFISKIRDRCYYFKNIFAQKFAKTGLFWLKQKVILQKSYHNIDFREEGQFFCWKLAKIAENCEHNIDPKICFLLRKNNVFTPWTYFARRIQFWKRTAYPMSPCHHIHIQNNPNIILERKPFSYNCTSSLAHYENKNSFFAMKNALILLQRWRYSCKFRSRRIGCW